MFLVSAFGMNFAIFASTMALEFGQNADGYGILSSVLAVGSLTGALLSARRERARLRVVILAAGTFGAASLVSSFMPTYPSYAVTLVFVGFATVTMMTTANGYVQTTTDPTLRGRVMALYMAVITRRPDRRGGARGVQRRRRRDDADPRAGPALTRGSYASRVMVTCTCRSPLCGPAYTPRSGGTSL